MSKLSTKQRWSWWPLLPLYPYGRKRTIFRELIPNQIWSFEQLQGIYYVAVPVRLLVVRVKNELMIINPLPPTNELLRDIDVLEEKIGPVKTIVLPTASGLEHKIGLPALARAFSKALRVVEPGSRKITGWFSNSSIRIFSRSAQGCPECTNTTSGSWQNGIARRR